MKNPQGYKNPDMDFADLCQNFYSAFGQLSTHTMVADLQEIGYLLDVLWKSCNACEIESPFWQNACLICGGI
jgi:hypothetical protein